MTDHLGSPTLFDLLRLRALEHEDAPLYTYLGDGEKEEQTYTYADLDRRACEIGGWLRDRGAVGKRVLLVYPQGLDYIAAFFGCIYAGAIAVPAYPPRRNRRAVRICSMVADADVAFALTTADLLEQMQKTIADEPCLANLPWQATDEVEAGCAEYWRGPEIGEASIAFLQYTSGSTGVPKGVMVSHGNILHNQHLIRHAFRQDEDMVQVGWLPLHHDMGLIGNVLHPLFMGGRLVFLSPVDFLQKPVRWLRAISRYGGTLSGGPNFAYDLCVEGIPEDQREGLDLSSWSVAFNGAEPVRGKTMSDFIAAFEPCGLSPVAFCPCYGMAETTLLLAGAIRNESIITTEVDAVALESGRVVSLVGDAKATELAACGIPDASMDTRIVDPDTEIACLPDQVGEIWVSGASVAQGYWRQRAATDETFRAQIRIPSNGQTIYSNKRYLRTGDLGFLHQGELYVTGRLKDLIIYCGANHYPQDIERTVEASHEGLSTGAGAAFSVEIDDAEQIVVVQEVKRSHMRTLDRDAAFATIREAVAEEHQIPLQAIVLIRPGAIPKTTSGKIQRREARRLFLEDRFKVVARWDLGIDSHAVAEQPPVQNGGGAALEADSPNPRAQQPHSEQQRTQIHDLQAWMLSRLSDRLGVRREDLDIREPFARYGMDSLKAVRLSGELSDLLGKPCAPTLAYDYPNIAALSEFLITGQSASHEDTSSGQLVDEPMAVVGIGCRFPGGPSVDSFWKLLRHGRDAISAAPPERCGGFAADATPFLRGGFIDNVDRFDARFFGINPREADELDPQQRLLLEVAWETFEDAGIPIDQLAGSRTGVFFGLGSNDYLRLQAATRHEMNGYTATGNSLAVAANRVSYTFDLRGPSLTIDTACSASLVAVHQACASLRLNQCELALAGGVNLILSSDATSSLDQAGMLSPTGACRAFSAAADGFVRSEGCGVVLLKPLSRAVSDGDRIYAVLRGSAINQDGRSNGLTAPNGSSQQAVIRKALAAAKLIPEEIDYVEAHGTGTELGDPIEMHSLGAVFAEGDTRRTPLRVGSVKTNIGHLEAAAGIAGLIKVCLALHHERLPSNLHFDQPSPHIDWTIPVEVPVEPQEWPASNRPRVAGVSSFGFGGTNAHVIVGEAPDQAPNARRDPAPAATLLTLSARSLGALQQRANDVAAIDPQIPLNDVCYSANSGRKHFDQRLAVRAESMQEIIEKLASFGVTGKASGLITGTVDSEYVINWLFSGQGGVHVGAGKRLYDAHGGFRAELDRCAIALKKVWPRPLTALLWEDQRWWREVDVQPALFCLQYALARLWQTWGVEPRAVLGHSLGEYAAACVAGVFSLEDALKLVTRRAELVGQLPRRGCMLAVFTGEEDVRSHLNEIDPLGQELDVACVNGPHQVVIAGGEECIATLKDRLASDGLQTRELATTHAFHSPLVDSLLDEFTRVAEKVTYSEPKIPYLSSLLGDWSSEQVATPEYWRRQLREPVRFYQASQKLTGTNGRYLEVGVGSTLSSLIRAAHPEAGLSALPGLTGTANEWEKLLSTLAKQYVNGANINWQAVESGKRRVVSLPTYPFERKRHWFNRIGGHAENDQVSLRGERVHPLLGTRLDLSSREVVFETDLSRFDYLLDHRVGASAVFPAAGYLEMALAAGDAEGLKRHEVNGLAIERPLSWHEDEECRVQVVLSPDEDGFECRIMHRAGDVWQRHATCRLAPDVDELPAEPLSPAAGETVDVADLYDRFRAAGLDYGSAFQGLRELFARDDSAWGEVELPSPLSTSGYLLHPSLLDSCLQITAGVLTDQFQQAWLPVRVERFRVFSTSSTTNVRARVRLLPSSDDATLQVDIDIAEPAGQPVARIEQLTLKPTRAASTPNLLYRESWIPRIRPTEPTPTLTSFSPSQLERSLIEQRKRIIQGTGIDGHVEMLEALESISTTWVLSALRELQVELRPGTTITTEAAAESAGIARSHHRLFGRMMGMLAEEGFLQRSGDGWTGMRLAPVFNPDDLSDRLLQRFPAGKPEVTLLRRCGSRLADVLRGEVDPLPLLFPQDDAVSAVDVYRDSIGGRTLNALVAESVGHAVARLEDGRGLRVLEIGAGTGATTESVLARLPQHRSRYIFTDIAPGFLSQARTKFSRFDNVEYRVLDIERDPAEQGFEAESFDLIIAANVLHATADLQESMMNVYRLLSPGGGLVVVEGTRPVRWLDLTFGLTPGWWRFQDAELRPDYPLLSANGWRTMLEELGFDRPRVIHPYDTTNHEQDPENSVIVSRRSVDSDTVETPSTPWIVFSDCTGIGDDVIKGLASRGQSCAAGFAKASLNGHGGPTRTSVAPGGIATWLKHVAAGRNTRDVVFLWPLDLANEDMPPPQQAQALSETVLEFVRSVADEIGDDNADAGEPLRLWIVTRGGQAPSGHASQAGLGQATLWGIVRTIAFEHPHWQCRGIDLDPAVSNHAAAVALLDELTAMPHDEEREVAFRDGHRLVRRLLAGDGRDTMTPAGENEATVLEIGAGGTIDGLQLSRRARRSLQDDQVEVDVHAAGLNFRDVLNVIGLVEGAPPLGAECTGIVSRVGPACNDVQVGDRVAVIAPHSICDVITVPQHALAKLPDELSLDDAATMPVVFMTALIALERLGGMRRGTRVLIHSAMGGVGQAAVQLAKQAGAEIFATASVGKHEALHKLGIKHVYDSRKPGFAQRIMSATGGAGVDLVLDSLVDEFLLENLNAVAEGGQYLDIAHPQPDTVRRAAKLRPDVVYHDIDLVEILERDPSSIRNLLDDVFRRYSEGRLKPLAFRDFPLSKAGDAFRFMRGGQHVGKILIKPEPGQARIRRPEPLADDRDRSLFRRDATYLITGGLGGLGLLTAKWMSELDVSNIALLARREPTASERQAIDAIETLGCRVTCLKANVSDDWQVDQALKSLRSTCPPLAGVFHMAGALDDGLMIRQTPEKFAAVFAPKVLGAWNLHRATTTDSLDYFVLFSSAASAFGSPGQSNNAAANSFLDMLAHHRRANGQPACSINWGPWAKVGAAAAKGVENRADMGGVGMLMPEEGLELFRRQLQYGSRGPAQVAALRLYADRMSRHLRDLPLFEMLLAGPSIDGGEHERRSRFLQHYRAAPSAERNGLMVGHLQKLVAATLGIDNPKSISPEEALFDLGLDSLTSLELRNALESSLSVKVSATVVFDYPTLVRLAEHFATQLDAAPVEAIEAIATASADQEEDDDAAQETRQTQLGDLIQSIDELTADLDRWEERQV